MIAKLSKCFSEKLIPEAKELWIGNRNFTRMPKIIAQATDPILIYIETKFAINTIKLISKNPGILFLKNLIRKFKV